MIQLKQTFLNDLCKSVSKNPISEAAICEIRPFSPRSLGVFSIDSLGFRDLFQPAYLERLLELNSAPPFCGCVFGLAFVLSV